MKNNHTAVEMTEKAKNNIFVDCEINGSVKMAGIGNKMIRTKINLFKKEHPFFFWLGVFASITGIIGFIFQIIK